MVEEKLLIEEKCNTMILTYIWPWGLHHKHNINTSVQSQKWPTSPELKTFPVMLYCTYSMWCCRRWWIPVFYYITLQFIHKLHLFALSKVTCNNNNGINIIIIVLFAAICSTSSFERVRIERRYLFFSPSLAFLCSNLSFWRDFSNLERCSYTTEHRKTDTEEKRGGLMRGERLNTEV